VSRLSVKLTLAFVGVTLVTILLLVVPQLRGIASENVALPPEERPQLTPATVGRALLQGARPPPAAPPPSRPLSAASRCGSATRP
jgi:hypothetical protein